MMKTSSPAANPFIVIRATVETEVPAPGILAISSAVSGDGKTAVAAGIARSLAGAGYSTLVLDAGNVDAIEPSSAQEALTVQAVHERLNHAVRATESGCDYLSLRDLGAGVTSSVSIAALYQAVRERYAYAVVDASVLNGTGLALARGADGVVLAIREGRPIVPADSESVELLNRLKVRFLGVVATTERHAGDYEITATLVERLKNVPAGTAALRQAAAGPAKELRGANAMFGWVRAAIPVRSSTRE
jgi:Mrp family chromosome partitioning ATPase